MLVLGWLTILLGVFVVLWADGTFAKINSGPARATVLWPHAD
jgi:hypothetical protein